MKLKPSGLAFLKGTVGEEGIEELKKYELFKPNSSVALDHEEIRTGLQIVPRAILSFLQNNLQPMKVGESKNMVLPVGTEATLRLTKKDIDVYFGDIIKEGRVIAKINNRSIPGVGLSVMTTFEMYHPEDLDEGVKPIDDVMSLQIQKIIDEKIYMRSLIGDIVEKKISEREAIDKVVKERLAEMLSEKKKEEVLEIGEKSASASDQSSKLKSFLEKKNSKKGFKIELKKGESVSCDSCGKMIFNDSGFSSCVCFGDVGKVYMKKSEDGVRVSFGKNWDEENIELLLSLIRSKNAK